MKPIGYSLVDETGKEVAFWGDIAGQEAGVPDVVRWPNGDRTHCPEVGMRHAGCCLVPRFLDQQADALPGIKFDGERVVVTRAT